MRALLWVLLVLLLCQCHAFLSIRSVGKGWRHGRRLRMVEELTVQPIARIQGEVTLPGSKSLSNRVLLLAAVSEGATVVENLLDSEDVRHMVAALRQLQVPIHSDDSGRTVVTGLGGPFRSSAAVETLLLGNAGTAMRPLTAMLAAGYGHFVLDGTARMRERPISDLISGLQQLGADVSCSPSGCPPVTIHAHGLRGGRAEVSGQVSSQFISALLMAAPLAEQTVTIAVTGALQSLPYVLMTIRLMQQFGVTVHNDRDSIFTVPTGQRYRSPGRMAVEGDASAASYFLAGAAITGGPVTVIGCGQDSLQGDVRFADILRKMGATVSCNRNSITVRRPQGNSLMGIDEHCGDIPDAAMTLAVLGLFAEGTTRVRGVGSWRVKECDRLQAMATEMRKLGATMEEGADMLTVHGMGGQRLKEGVHVDTYGDHRIAMCFALAACAGVSVVIRDPRCVDKTFPDYFQRLAQLSASPEHVS